MATVKFNNTGMRVKVEGLRELKANLDKLKDDVRKRVIGAAAAAGAVVIRDQAKKVHKWKSRTGSLQEAIKHRRSRKGSTQDYELRQIGVFKTKGGKYANNRANRRLERVGKEYQEDPPEYYWKFLEFGTVRGIGPNEFSFLRPAFNAKKEDAATRTKEVLAERIAKAVATLPKPRKP